MFCDDVSFDFFQVDPLFVLQTTNHADWQQYNETAIGDCKLAKNFNDSLTQFNSKSLFAILHEYTHTTEKERANNTYIYAASFTSNKVQGNHKIKWQKGARNLRRFMGPLTVEQVYFEKRNKTSAGSASAASSRYRAVLKLWVKIHNFMMDLNLYQFLVNTFFQHHFKG